MYRAGPWHRALSEQAGHHDHNGVMLHITGASLNCLRDKTDKQTHTPQKRGGAVTEGPRRDPQRPRKSRAVTKWCPPIVMACAGRALTNERARGSNGQ